MRESGSPERRAPRETDCGNIGSAEPLRSRRRRCRHRSAGLAMIELPGVIESGMPRKNGQRKPGTTRGSPRRSRTAKALRISRHAVKSRCARGWGGWGRLSDDGSRSITRTGARTPGAEDYPTSKAAHDRMLNPTQCGIIEFTTMCAKDRHKPHTSRRMPGAGLNQWCAGRCCPTCRPSSRIGENPPYGMIGRVEETSASYEARSAPQPYPTAGARVTATAMGAAHPDG